MKESVNSVIKYRHDYLSQLGFEVVMTVLIGSQNYKLDDEERGYPIVFYGRVFLSFERIKSKATDYEFNVLKVISVYKRWTSTAINFPWTTGNCN